jgi:transposase
MVDLVPSSIKLSPQQKEALEVIIEELENLQDPDWPARAILMWNDGIPQSDAAIKLDIAEEAVELVRRRWLSAVPRISVAEAKVSKAFNTFFSLVCDAISQESPTPATPGAPTGTTKAGAANQGLIETRELRSATKALIEIIHHQPNAYGINRSNWTLQSLAEAFEKLYGQKPSKSTVSRLLKEGGLRWKRSRRVLTSPDPTYREKVELLLKTLQSMKPHEDLFFIDELGPLQVKKYGGRCYTPKGETRTHPQNQRSRGAITLCGALSANTNQVTWFYQNTKDSAGIIDMVEILYNCYHDKSKIYLTWDAASWHKSALLGEWLDAFNGETSSSGFGPTIHLVPLPTSSQFLDVIEAVFSGMKRAVIHHSDYQSEDEMKTAISRHFVERNGYFRDNPKRAGKKIWEIDFFQDMESLNSGNYREW